MENAFCMVVRAGQAFGKAVSGKLPARGENMIYAVSVRNGHPTSGENSLLSNGPVYGQRVTNTPVILVH